MSLSEQEKRPPPRPKQVSYAVYFISSSIVFNVLLQSTARIINALDSDALPADPFGLVCLAVGYLVAIYVAVFVAAGKSWARTIFLIGFVLESIAIFRSFGDIANDLLIGSLVIFATGLNLIALILLYRPVSTAWFKEKKAFELLQKDGAGQEPVAEPDLSPVMAAETESTAGVAGQNTGTAQAVAAAAAVGAAMGLLNGLLWAVSLPPQTEGEQQLIYFLIISGLVFGALLGAVLGFISLQFARRDPGRNRLRWAITAGALGGLMSFGCGFLAMVMSFG